MSVSGFTARHPPANTAAALARVSTRSASRAPRRPVEVEFSRCACEELAAAGGGLLINDAYNANPASMRAALEHLVERAGARRKVAVLGEMAELGGDGPALPRRGARRRPRSASTSFVGVGELARRYGPDEWVATAAQRRRGRAACVRPGDTVLVKGSRSVGLEVVAERSWSSPP